VGALVGATVVTALLSAGATILPILITRAGLVYGSFATVVGAFTLLYLISQTLVLSVELSTVAESRLAPRGLTTATLIDADRRALLLQARRQERVAGQRNITTFSGEAERPPGNHDHQV
jgi:uncharacterized BrkB/YihY/UPF0761 family membrane protein